MRPTLAIDDDILATVQHLAQRDRKNIGEVISGLARQGLAREARAERSVIPLLPSRPGASPVTPELLNQLRDELA